MPMRTPSRSAHTAPAGAPIPPPPKEPTRYLTVDEAAAFLRLSPKTLNKRRSIGGGPKFHKFGRVVRYAAADLEAWADARSFEATCDPEYPVLRAAGVAHER